MLFLFYFSYFVIIVRTKGSAKTVVYEVAYKT